MLLRFGHIETNNSRPGWRFSYAIAVSFLVLLSGCGLEKPEAPNWTIDLLVPIANRHIDGPYIASHAGTDYLKWNSDSGLVWQISAELDTVLVGDKIRTHPPLAGGTFELGSVVVGQNSELSCRIDLEDVAPLAAGVVPELTTTMSAALQNTANIDSLNGASGEVLLTIENELGVAVDQVTVTLSSNGSGPLASFVVPGTIASGSSQTATHTISNLACGSDWSTTLAFHTPGGTVLTAADKHISVRASFPNGLTANYARAAVDASSREYSDSLVLSDTHQLSAATIASGQLIISWTNSTPLPATILWNSPDLFIHGSSLTGHKLIPAGSTENVAIDLTGASYSSSGTLSSARVAVSVQSQGSNGQLVEVRATNSFGYSAEWSEVVFATATGQIAQTQFSTGTHTTALEWDNGLESAGLDQWDAYLVVRSSLPLNAQITGQVTTNTGLHLPVNGTVLAETEGATAARLILDHDNTPLSPLPSEVQFSGTVRIGGSGDVVSIDEADFVSAAVEFSAPAHMYVDDVALTIDPTLVTLSGEDFGDRTNRLINAVVTITVANRFPMGGQFTLRMASDSSGVDSDGALVFGPSTLLPAVTDASGNAISVSNTELTYALDSADLSLFESEVIWFAESLTLLGPGHGQPARISPLDALDWNAHARIEYKVDGDVRPWEK